ncbi:ABC transporter ATP-binding protein [Pseudonocardia hierapolitana]|uniref:ABC transporter ATP-binding protein n=1 Tax=Pseudonocardia hierapolitana TaxID=1128676 RepID=UPI001FE81447|nr:ABC transporter ATP-binding protein [Pseudonocardia hierapolitana]
MTVTAVRSEEGTPVEPVAEPPQGASLLALAEPVRRRLVVAVALGAAGAVLGVAGLVALAYALRELFRLAPDGTALLVPLVAAAVGVVGRYGLRAWAFQVSHMAAFDLETVLRTRLAAHLGRVSLGDVLRLGSGPLKKIVQDDVRAMHSAVADATPLVGFAVAQPVAALVALAVVDWRMLLAVLVIVPVVVVAMQLAMRDHATERARYDRANESINAAVVEFVQGMPVVRTFDDGSTSFRRFAAAVEGFTEATANWQRKSRTPGVLARIAMTPVPTLLVVLAVGIWLVAGGLVEPAWLLVALLIGTLPVESILPLMYLNNYVNDSKAGAARIASVLALPELAEPAHPRPPGDGSVRLRGVTFGYGTDRGRPALDGVDLEIPAGTVCALVGPSGSGKSTLARLVARFHDVVSGSVEVGGVDVREIGTPGVLRHVALVFQDPFLIDDTVAENIRLGRPEATEAEVEAAARAAGAHDFIVSELPDGYATRVGERGGLLSGGQRQRVTIARAMLVDAPIVVLDEATAFADPETEAQIQESIAALTRGRTVIVIAHQLATVAGADQIVVLGDGRVAERGTHIELLAAGGSYARMWEHHERARAWGVRA